MSTPSMRSARKRRGLLEAGLDGDRAQVGVEPQHLADLEQALLRAHRRGWVIPLGTADRAEEDRVALEHQVEVLVAHRLAVGVDGDAASEHVGPLDAEAELLGGGIKNGQRRLHDLRADAVARDLDDVVDGRAFLAQTSVSFLASEGEDSWPSSFSSPAR